MLKHFLLIITSFALIFSQDNNSREPALGQWRWNHESLEWTHDKETHAAGSFGL